MSSSKSKKRSSSEAKKSVYMSIGIPSEHQQNCHTEIEEEETTREAPQSKSKGKEVARQYSQRAECWQHFVDIKENGKRVAGKYKVDPNKNGTKNLKNHFPKCSKNPDNQSKQMQAQLIFEKD